jgi:hypothetical protein
MQNRFHALPVTRDRYNSVLISATFSWRKICTAMMLWTMLTYVTKHLPVRQHDDITNLLHNMATLRCSWVKVGLLFQPYRTKPLTSSYSKRKYSKIISYIFSLLSYIYGNSTSGAAEDNSYVRILLGARIFIPVFSLLSLFWKNKIGLWDNHAVCLSITLPPRTNVGMYIMVLEPI